MKKSIIGIFLLSFSVVSCVKTGEFLAASLPKNDKKVKCIKLGTARQVVNSKGETCNEW